MSTVSTIRFNDSGDMIYSGRIQITGKYSIVKSTDKMDIKRECHTWTFPGAPVLEIHVDTGLPLAEAKDEAVIIAMNELSNRR